MPVVSPLFNLQANSQKEADEWILVLIGALRKKSNEGEWSLRIVHNDGEDLTFECYPLLSNEDVSEMFVRYHVAKMTAKAEDLREDP